MIMSDFRCFCQVFYHKLEGFNHWKATLAFFSYSKTDVSYFYHWSHIDTNIIKACFMWYTLRTVQRVKQFYQDANLGLTIEDVQFISTIGKPMIYPSFKTMRGGWNVVHNGLRKVCKETAI